MDECKLIRSGDHRPYQGKQGLSYFEGISAQSAGARGLCMHLLTIPPGGRARAHLHAYHESAVYVISGEAEMWWGEGLREHMIIKAGDFVYIPAGVPHLPANRSRTEPCIGIIARTDPNEQESVVLLPELDSAATNRPPTTEHQA
ncbi:MAG: cupin domain-containing protein [Anaerolineae bacterium]|nr:cupin domain-containing protein [Anaerolineae bacterium]